MRITKRFMPNAQPVKVRKATTIQGFSQRGTLSIMAEEAKPASMDEIPDIRLKTPMK
eukprot:CAMPEP_0172721386 /NCGR_PEP_ID=MMETSP1074-20121228/79010_1 /TAXON_ID=2916 /ORGANISM="Ceratium fusus, Strain PA161109" /LENGTH=56 /DNA_ID=CAMNT_0013547117 /DNA_START=373 /DNA_END=543 /DNA_ORIENTATION=-